MTTPRVTEIPIALAAVEPDPFIEVAPRAAAPQRRIDDGDARARQLELVRRAMRGYGSSRRSRNARSSASRVASSGAGSGVAWSDPTSLRMSSR
jgi:hypothetical protein